MLTMEKPLINQIYEAQERLESVVIQTPLVPSNILSGLKEGKIFFKLENLQRTGSFKIRGAYNKLAQLSPSEIERGVIAASAGNHAQGVALSAKILGIQARIFMPVTAPLTKIEATEKYGATVKLIGETFDETKQAALDESVITNEIFIPPYDDYAVIAGQGTIGLEILETIADVDQIILPIGGGGLIAGVATIAKTINPAIKIIGVQSYNVHGMLSSIWNQQITANRSNRTLADGCDVAIPGDITYRVLSPLIDETVLVEEEVIKQAIEYLAYKEKIVAEGAGALTAAAIMSGALDHLLINRKTVAVVSGGNIDSGSLKEII
ncbi:MULTISPECIES: pyridoxal-phosphate dependent enzyme [Enterococcus]|uniref:threonine ammonia-lyase n=1 Tax=Enterococcus alcedinis TaxID=1274384 RepID=A0A917JFU8_9ENTE|nr:pyridoxal-phosphate dependent enzyme [Enterococcus alcedinis]MBP2101763.1 threonine dehydratase [Enterococcus alcedinis]GGI65327.1 L-threonine dehydratase catabolic TdcB [Enterococcus alcedinis]